MTTELLPGAFDARFRPGVAYTLRFGASTVGWLSSYTFTASLGGTALGVAEDGDDLVVTISGAITTAQGATEYTTFLLTEATAGVVVTGRWEPSLQGTLAPTSTVTVVLGSIDVTVDLTVGPAAGAGTIRVEDEGISTVATASALNFAGAGVTVTDAGAGEALVTIPGAVDTSGTPVALDFARFTDADTIEGRDYGEVRSDLGLVIGTNVQAYDADLSDLAAIADAQGDIIVRGAAGWERLAKSATATDLLAAGAAQPEWVAAPSGASWPLDHSGATAATDAVTLDVTGDANLRFVLNHDGSVYMGNGTLAPVQFLRSELTADTGTGAGAPGSCHLGHLAGLVDTSQFATSFGNEALMANTTGLYNTAIGARVLRNLIDGDYNTAVGMDTAQRITTGNNNVAMGVSAMSYVTTTSDNTAIGFKALQQNTGYQNVVIGASANLGAGAAYSNVIIGANTAGAVTSGPLNVIVGQGAAGALTTNGANVVIGQGAYALGSAGYNTAVGWEAMAGAVTGEENVAMGRRALTRPAGTLANATTSGAFNVAIGDETGQASTTARSNMTLVGYRALGDAAGAVAIGSTAQALHAGGIALGDTSVTTAVNQLELGSRHIEIVEMTEPAAGAANSTRVYAKDNGSGKTQLCVRFASGDVQILATEP